MARSAGRQSFWRIAGKPTYREFGPNNIDAKFRQAESKLASMKVQRRALVLFISMSLCVLGCGHNLVTFDSPEQVVNILRLGNDEQQARVKKELHMPWVLGKDCEGEPADECGVEIKTAVLEQGKENAVIQVAHYFDFLLIVLVRNKNGTWQYSDSMPLSAAYNFLTVTFQSIVNPPVQEIVVHKHVPLHGSGIYQANFLILKVIDGRLRVVLDTIEESNLTQDWTGGPLLMQRSAFEVIPKTGDKSAYVRETQTFVIGDRSAQWERAFYWDDDLHTFQVSLWTTYKPLTPNKLSLPH
jgi:hypothetical protein